MTTRSEAIRNRNAFKATEKDQEQGGDRLMHVLGFTRWTLSQARETRQTRGWPDRFYTNATRGLAVFWEAKREGGKQRADQKVFMQEVGACGIEYVVGTMEALAAWCEAKRLVRVLPSGGYEVLRSPVSR